MYPKRLTQILLLSAFMVGLALNSRAQVVTYTITGLGTLGGTNSYASDLNEAGEVVGRAQTSGGAYHAFLYSNGDMQDLGTLGGTQSFANGLNEVGQVVGSAQISGDTAYHAFLYSNGTTQDLGTLGGTFSTAADINDIGQVVGWAHTSGGAYHAFLYSNGEMQDLGTLGGTQSFANGLNGVGQVVGDAFTSGNAARHAFLYSNGEMQDLGTLGGTQSIANDVNDAGQVVGWAHTSGDVAQHTFLYSNGEMQDLGTLGGTQSFANGLNEMGQVVGQAQTSGNVAWHAFLYSNGTMQDLNDLLPAGSGWILSTAYAINDDGEIVGIGFHNGVVRAFLLKIDDAGPLISYVEATPNPVAVGMDVNLEAHVDDTTTGNSHISSAEYELWNSAGILVGSGSLSGSFDSPSVDVFTMFNTPTSAGVYELCVYGTDAAGNSGPDECIFLVVYDPDGGFVTGGGWIYSEAGWCQLDDACAVAEGKANFGFVSKYKKGASVPTGTTEFNFKAGNLNFHSDTYDWLVVNQGGTNAQFKGSGTINDGFDLNGNPFKFLLWAGDGDSDTFRIKIWWEDVDSTENVVYDNGLQQAVDGGNIKIHTK